MQIFVLLVLFQIKHFLADYVLQGEYMLGKFKSDWSFFFPLLAHSGVNACFTLAICLWAAPHLWWLALVDLVSHFIMDRIKAGPNYLGRHRALTAQQIKDLLAYENTAPSGKKYVGKEVYKKRLRGNVFFWWALGFDQMVHHLVHYCIIFTIVMVG